MQGVPILLQGIVLYHIKNTVACRITRGNNAWKYNILLYNVHVYDLILPLFVLPMGRQMVDTAVGMLPFTPEGVIAQDKRLCT